MTILSIHTTTWKRNTFLLAYVIQAKIEKEQKQNPKGFGKVRTKKVCDNLIFTNIQPCDDVLIKVFNKLDLFGPTSQPIPLGLLFGKYSS